MKNTLIVFVSIITLTYSAGASVINIALHNGGVTVAGFDAEADGNIVSAGSNGSDTWNNIVNNGGVGLSFSGFPLLLSDGSSSGGATASGSTEYAGYNNNGWGGNGDDYVMMEGWYGFKDAESLTISGLSSAFTADGYTVTIYGDANSTDREMKYTIDGTTKTIQDSGTFSGTFSEGVNVATFTELTDASFTITGNSAAVGGSGRSAINGIIIEAANPAAPPSILFFTASSTNVFAGDSVTLDWGTSLADTVTLNGAVTGLTTTQVVMNADTTFELIAENTNGSVTSSIPVTIITTPPDIQSFAASNTNPFPGAEITLSWQVDDATGLSIDQGLGDVTGITSTQLVINADITYTLTATNVNGSSVESVDITVNQNPILIYSDFDGTTGGQILESGDNSSGSPTLGITDWATHASVTSISDLTAISPGGTFVNMAGAPFASPDNVYINHNLNIDDRADPRGYSLTFTTDTAWNLGALVVRAGHSNNTGLSDQVYASDLTFVLDGGTLGSPVTGTSVQEDYGVAPAYHDVNFDLSGTTIGAGIYSLEVTANNMGGGGAYAIFDGILLSADAPRNQAVLTIAGPVPGGMEISWLGDAGSTYRVETNSNLIVGNWNIFQSGITGTGNTLSVTNAVGPDQTFYRVITE